MTDIDTAEHGTGVTSDLREALEAVAGVVGQERVCVRLDDDEPAWLAPAQLGNNTGMFRQRRILSEIKPRTAQEARHVVEIFARRAGSGSLHVISTGRNWGLGSREPAHDDAVVLDLSGLDQVHAMDVDAGWAVIGPGVTQGRMAEVLAGTDRMVNVTSSSAHSSVVGNALDRGVGLRHQRVEDLVGLEVVLPDGEVMRVGWWPDAERPTAVYAHGLGPSLVQTFVQSNFGVVTAAAIRLLPRPEALRVVRLTFTPAQLGPAVTRLRRWVAQGLVSGVLKVYNPTAARGYGNAPDMFLAHVCVDGTAESVEALTAIITDEARSSSVFTEVSATDSSDPDSEHHQVTTLVERSYWGDPDVTDTVFETKMGGITADGLDDEIGFLFFLPLVPFAADSLVEAEELLRGVAQETGIACGGTLNALGPDVIDLVVSMKFSRTDEQAAQAHRALDLLYKRFTAAGFIPYRLDVDHHDWIDRCGGQPAARAFVRRLKAMIDPDDVVAPGRYF